MLSFSKYLANALMSGGATDLRGLLNTSDLYLYIYSGPVPANADAAASGATKLCKVTLNGSTGASNQLSMDATLAADGVLQKTIAEVWKCLQANITNGTAAFYRLCNHSGDDGSGASTTGYGRVQGTVGVGGADLIVPTTSLDNAHDFGPIDVYQLQMLLT